MTSTTRSALVGATLAVVVVAAVVGGFVLLRGRAAGALSATAPSKVVVVFALAGEDDAVTAQMVAVVDMKTGTHETIDTSRTVTIPGTSYSALRDAYPFGGAAAVAAALAGGTAAPDTAWVDVSPAAWSRLVAAGVEVTLTENFDTFDGQNYSTFPIGAQRIAAVDFRGFVNGLAYQPEVDRVSAREAIIDASLAELGASAAGVPAGVTTSLSPAGWTAFAGKVR